MGINMLKEEIVELSESEFLRRYKLNEKYLLSLSSENLLRGYLFQSGLWSWSGSSSTTIDLEEFIDNPSDWHSGWESLTSELRGHFLGHWLSAASRTVKVTGQCELRGKIEYIIDQLSLCQNSQDDGWVAAIPREMMHRMAKGKSAWAPHYTLHKLFMGLIESYTVLGLKKALLVAENLAEWLYQWSDTISEHEMDDILDYETGGMLEVWADLYALTDNKKYLTLIKRYTRKRFFNALIAGDDVLSNKHSNTQIVEILGAERVWEVTGDEWFRKAADAFWVQVVGQRKPYITGGYSCGELWTPPGDLSSRLGETQEHCVVYNMIRLAYKRLLHTGDIRLADFIEKNIYNGMFAQQHPYSGMVTYFLGMGPGSHKRWGSPTRHFWCCHGTLIQAQAYLPSLILQKDELQRRLYLTQYIPFRTSCTLGNDEINISLTADNQHGAGPISRSNSLGKRQIQRVDLPQIPFHRPDKWRFILNVKCKEKTNFALHLRLPAWASGELVATVAGLSCGIKRDVLPGQYIIEKDWLNDQVIIEIPKTLAVEPLAGNDSIAGICDGPIVLAALTKVPFKISSRPEDFLVPHNERHHSFWNEGQYVSSGEHPGVMFVPLMNITDQTYTVYFPYSKPM